MKKKWDGAFTKIDSPNTLIEEIENEQLDEIESFIEDIYALRKSSIAEEGEYSIGNLIFKECRNKGYLDNLKELKNKIIGDELSLGESLEDTLDQDLVDNRQPVDFSVLEYDEPFDHKSNLAHEKCLVEEEYVSPYDQERNELITRLRAAGYPYNFDRFSNAQLYRMLQKPAPKKPEPVKTVVARYCSNCGTKLTERGECPVCDLGEEDLGAEDLDEGFLSSQEMDKYRIELSRIAQSGVQIWDNGRFQIHNINSSDINNILYQIRGLDYIDHVNSTGGNYNWSSTYGQPWKLPDKICDIYGQIHIEEEI